MFVQPGLVGQNQQTSFGLTPLLIKFLESISPTLRERRYLDDRVLGMSPMRKKLKVGPSHKDPLKVPSFVACGGFDGDGSVGLFV